MVTVELSMRSSDCGGFEKRRGGPLHCGRTRAPANQDDSSGSYTRVRKCFESVGQGTHDSFDGSPSQIRPREIPQGDTVQRAERLREIWGPLPPKYGTRVKPSPLQVHSAPGSRALTG
ncbi:hypothetical protein GCM10027403_23130 [Arthrobacter tecti]